MSTKFRDDIQGLRGYALTLIVMGHAGIHWFPGAFLAVDIFFVISGFLITGIILRQQEAGKFSYLSFIARRVRRLMPAAVVTVFLTMIAGYFVYSSADYEAVGKSALAAIFSVVNILFWRETGYFDAAVYTKPFLHYWSLSVEEQFYLVWPIVLVVAARLGKRALATAAVISIFVVSLLGAELIAYDRNPAAAFFLTPFRAFEFMIGAIVAVTGVKVTAKYWRELVYLAGLVLMFGSMYVFNEYDRMPGYLSLFALVGCAMLIAAPGAKLSVLMLPRPVVYLGNASYSIYLVHWPITAILKYTVAVELPVTLQWAAVIAAYPVGLLLYHFVEKPFRSEKTWQVFGNFAKPAGIGGLAVVSALAVSIWLGDGFRFRYPNATGVEFDPTAMRELTTDYRDANNLKPLSEEHPNFYVIGDSMGADASVMISLLRPEATVHHNWIGKSCQSVYVDYNDPKISRLTRDEIKKNVNCNELIAEAYDPNVLVKYDLIILAARWAKWAPDYLPQTFAKIREHTDAPIIVFGMGAMFSSDVPKIVETAQRLQDVRYLFGIDRVGTLFIQNPQVEKYTNELGGIYLDKFSQLCPKSMCQVLDLANPTEPFYSDWVHLSMSGEKYWAAQVKACETPACEVLKTWKKSEGKDAKPITP